MSLNRRIFVSALVGLPYAVSIGVRRATGQVSTQKLLTCVASIAEQKMQVWEDAQLLYTWPVSTASSRNQDCMRGTCVTPVGTFGLTRVVDGRELENKWGSYMYWPMYFDNEGDAIHGTDHEELLGQEDSHGCIRISKANAKILHALVLPHRVEHWEYKKLRGQMQRVPNHQHPGVVVTVILGRFNTVPHKSVTT